MFDVDKQTIKTWAYTFAAYLSSSANPGSGLTRHFLIEDIRVLAYVSMYWEESPDLESIKTGLNSSSQYDDEGINDFITQLIPLFQNMPENIDETWRGTVFGGEFELGDIFSMADSFKMAGDKLTEIAHQESEERRLFQPAIYNYRHATELYIKAVIGEEVNHDLDDLLGKLKIVLKSEFDTVPPGWFINTILAFHKLDPKGTTFRYGDVLPTSELFVDLRHVKKLMSWLGEVFRRIQLERHRKMFST